MASDEESGPGLSHDHEIQDEESSSSELVSEEVTDPISENHIQSSLGIADQSDVSNPETSAENDLEKPSPSHVLVEGPNLEDLKRPIKASSRIRYTCLSVSSTHLAIGTSTGAIYVFDKTSLQHLQMITGDVKDGAICALAFGPSGSTLAYATSQGMVIILELHLEKRAKPDRQRSTTDHKGASVTALCWAQDGTRVFVGDSNGLVTAVNTASKTSDLLRVASEVIMRLERPVVQIDSLGTRVLVSTTKSSYVANTSTHKFVQIGKKPRDGPYGACFYPVFGVADLPIVYCARPGSRVWESSADGDVFNTHQFKCLLDIPSTQILPLSGQNFSMKSCSSHGPQSLAFKKLFLLGNHFLLAVTASALFILDPAEVKVVLWTNEIQGVQSIVCHKSEIFCLFERNSVRSFSFLPVVKYAIALSLQPDSAPVLRYLLTNHSYWVTKTQSKCDEMCRIAEDLISAPDLDSDERKELERIHQKLKRKQEALRRKKLESKDVNPMFTRSESGIYIMKERSTSVCSDDLENHDALLERVNAKQKQDPDSVSLSSNISENDIPKIEDRLMRETKLKLDGLKNMLKRTITRRASDSVLTPGSADDPGNEKIDSPAQRESPVPVIEVDSAVDSGLEPVQESAVEGVSEMIINEKVEDSAAVEQSTLTKSGSSESLLSFDDDKNGTRPRRGSLTSNDVSISSSELMFGAPSIDPEPVYAKTYISISHKGKKKKPAVIDLDDQSAESSPAVQRRVRKSRKSSRGSPSAPLLKKSTSLPAKMSEDSTQLPTECSPHLPVSPQKMSPASPGSSPVETPSPEPSASSSPGVTSALLTVKDRVGTTARSLMSLLKEGASKVRGSRREVTEVDPSTIGRISRDSLILGDRPHLKNDANSAESEDNNNEAKLAESAFDLGPLRRATSNAREQMAKDSSDLALHSWVIQLNQAVRDLHILLIGQSYKETEENENPHLEIKENDAKSDSNHDADSAQNPEHSMNHDMELTDGDIIDTRETEQSAESVDCTANESPAVDLSCISPEVMEKVKAPFYFEDPFPLDSELRADVQELARFCLQKRIFGSIQRFLDLETTNAELSSVQEAEDKDDSFDEMMTFVRCHYHLLDFADLHEASQQMTGDREKFWSALMDCEIECREWEGHMTQFVSQKDFHAASHYLQYCIENDPKKPFLGALPSLMEIDATSAAKLFGKRKLKGISPLDVLFLLRRIYASDKHQINTFLVSYTLSHLQSSDDSNAIHELCSDDEVLLCVLEALLRDQTHPRPLSCSCGLPLPQSHLHDWKHKDIILDILSLKPKPETFESVKVLAYTYHFWTGYLRLLRQSIDSNHLMATMVLQLGDFDLMSNASDFGYLPSCEESWQKMLCLRKLQDSGLADLSENQTPAGHSNPHSAFCLKCGQQLVIDCLQPENPSHESCEFRLIPWEKLVEKLITDVGMNRALQILMDVQLPDGSLEETFFNKFLLAKALEKKQSLLLEEKCKAFKSEVSSKQPPTLPLQVSLAAQLEYQSAQSNNDDFAQRLLTAELLNNFSSAKGSSGHWGKRLDINQACEICGDPLKDVVSFAIPGMVVHKCGHSFHRFCSQNDLCPVCPPS